MFPMQNAVPARYPPFVTWALIAVNFAVFFIEITLSPAELEWFLARFALIPARYFAPPPYGDPGLTLLDYVPFFSNMFLHGGWLHLMLNMWTLWLSARPSRIGLGSRGICCSILPAAFSPPWRIPSSMPVRSCRPWERPAQSPVCSDASSACFRSRG